MKELKSFLTEVKYKDLNNLKVIKTMDDVKRAAHSQGYEVTDSGTHAKHGSHGTVSLQHRKTGEPVEAGKDRGAIGGKKTGKAGEVESTTVNTVAQALKADMKKRGRVDKRPAAKAARKAEAEANKAKKAKNRDPFTREQLDLWLANFLNERAGGPASPGGRERAAKQAAQNSQNQQANAKARAADAQAERVRQKQEKLAKERKEADAAAKKVEAQVKKYQPARNAADKAAKEAEAKVRNTPAKTPQDNVSGSAERLKQQQKARDEQERIKAKGEGIKKARNAPGAQRARAKANVEDRKKGVGGGIKSALGGDVIGMRAPRGKKENALEKQERQKMNKQARGDFAKKKTQDAGRAVGGFVRGAFAAAEKGKATADTSDSKADSVQGSKEKEWGRAK